MHVSITISLGILHLGIGQQKDEGVLERGVALRGRLGVQHPQASFPTGSVFSIMEHKAASTTHTLDFLGPPQVCVVAEVLVQNQDARKNSIAVVELITAMQYCVGMPPLIHVQVNVILHLASDRDSMY